MKNKIILTALLLAILFPSEIFAAQKIPFSYGAWIPFWKKQPGAQEFAKQMDRFNEISPFSYEVKNDGTLADSLKMDSGFWPGWIGAVKDGGVKVIPTVALLDGDKIHNLLSNKKSRAKHVANIVSLVKIQKYDGIDIDYEDKYSKTEPYFSAFLKELRKKLPAKKILSCTIESRTPLADRFKVIPPDLSYANNYKVINKYCDEVRIMAYDQGNIDLTLNSRKGSDQFYMPVADPDWVEKVLKETVKTISRKKIMLGIPSYGYVYEVSQDNSIVTYKRLRSITYQQAIVLANSVSSTPLINNANELSFTYATSSSMNISKNLTYTITSTINALANPALLNPSAPIMRYVSFNDGKTMAKKIQLAKKFKLRGVVFFKIDGDNDPALWDYIK